MAVAYGTRINDDTNFITTVDVDNETCETTGYIDGEAVDFSGGSGSSDFTTAEAIITDSVGNTKITGIVVTPISLEPDGLRTSQGERNTTFLLYKGSAILTFETAAAITEYSGDFNITESEQEDDVWYTTATITGDCEITVTGLGM